MFLHRLLVLVAFLLSSPLVDSGSLLGGESSTSSSDDESDNDSVEIVNVDGEDNESHRIYGLMRNTAFNDPSPGFISNFIASYRENPTSCCGAIFSVMIVIGAIASIILLSEGVFN